jgi:hypothetical protein
MARWRVQRHERTEYRSAEAIVQRGAECRQGTEYLTVGGAESQALSAHATYQNVSFVDCNLLVEVSCVVTQINKNSIRPESVLTHRRRPSKRAGQ